jgi:regulation of enolase protein 1 (concanavalin A-like superfamily)
VPKAKDEAFKKAPWGKPLDPDKDCKFTFTKDSVTIEVPGKAHDYYGSGRTNAPRLLRPVKGDFVAEVRVRGEWEAAGKEDPDRTSPFVTGALLLVGEKEKQGAFCFEFGTHLRRKEQVALSVLSERKADGSGVSCFWYGFDAKLKPQVRPGASASAYLKLERRGATVSCSVSADGKKWESLQQERWRGPTVNKFAGDGRVGVAAFTTSTKPAKVTFDRFNLTPLKPKAK